jgi:hypothetical protein
MISLLCVFLIQSSAPVHPGIDEAVRRLRDDSIDVRDRAAEELVDFGKAALPALQGLRSAPDPELRGRVLGILRSIEQQETLRKHYRKGPRIALSLDQVPLSTALGEMARQAGDSWKYAPEETGEAISLHLKDASVFEALEAICRASPSLTYTFEEDALAFARKKRPSYPAVRSGEFQVWLDGFGFQQEYDFTGTPHHSFWLGVNVAWERGIAPVGLTQRILEVHDEKGNSLLAGDRPQAFVRNEGLKGRTQRNSFFHPLPPGTEGAQSLSLVKGQVVLVFPKAYEEVTLPLDAVSPSARLGDATVTLRNLRQIRTTWSFELIHTLSATPADMAQERISSVQVVLVDDLGAEHPATAAHRGTAYGGQTITLMQNATATLPAGRSAPRARLRLLKETWEKKIPFEFSDLRLE